eukprot:maker-scaffold_2-snap-gene-10.1-mRNA-1 protein AED:0.00 eAED:0.00 QI:96/1/1/1/1/1/3/137/193
MERKRKRVSRKSLTSLEVFQKYVSKDEQGETRILSRECFEKWVSTRRKVLKEPEKSFRKALVAHLRNRDGRLPFTEEEEEIILEELRKNKPWPCFSYCRDRSYIGVGTRVSQLPGFHESKRWKKEAKLREKKLNEVNLKEKKDYFYVEPAKATTSGIIINFGHEVEQDLPTWQYLLEGLFDYSQLEENKRPIC